MQSMDKRIAHSGNDMISFKRNKVAVIREEFVELTGHPFRAILLNQLYYWSQKVSDFDDLLQEELDRRKGLKVQMRHGWIYKGANEFIAETLLKVSKFTFYRHMEKMIESGWIESKEGASCKWDKTRSYRLNLTKLSQDLYELGYDLPAVFHDSYKKMAQTSKLQNETSRLHPATSELQNATYNKITDKITNKESPRYELEEKDEIPPNDDSQDLILEENEDEKIDTPVEMRFMSTEDKLHMECQGHVDTIEDPLWRTICDRLLNCHSPSKGSNLKNDMAIFLKNRPWEYILSPLLDHEYGLEMKVFIPPIFGNIHNSFGPLWCHDFCDYSQIINTYLCEYIKNKTNSDKKIKNFSTNCIEAFEKSILSNLDHYNKKRAELILRLIEKRKGDAMDDSAV